MQFLNGGLYYLMVSGEKAPVNWGIFFSECGINFPMHIKISLLMVLIYMILLPAGMFFVNVLGMMGGNLVGSSAFIMMLVKLGVLGLILLGASFFSDSLRAASAAFPDKSFGDITRIAAKYFRPRLLMLLGVFIVLFIPFVLIWVAV